MSSDNYSIKPTEFKKVEEKVLQLWEENGYKNRKKLLDWAFGECTFRPPMKSSFFVLLNNDDTIVGCCGVVERKIKLFDEYCSSGYPNNFLVDKNHRSLGPALQVQKNVINLKNYQVIFAIPNDKSDGVLRRVGYKAIGKMERWVLVLKTEKYLKKHFDNAILVKTFSFLADIFLSIKYELKGNNIKGISTDVKNSFDDRFNSLWEKASKSYSIVGERNIDYLIWRFSHYPFNVYKIFTLQDSNNELVAYVVFCKLKDGYYIDDLFAENEEMYVLLLKKFLKYSREQNRDSISFRFFGDPIVFSAMEKVGFKKRSDSNSVLIFSNIKNENIYNKDKWFLTAADMDV